MWGIASNASTIAAAARWSFTGKPAGGVDVLTLVFIWNSFCSAAIGPTDPTNLYHGCGQKVAGPWSIRGRGGPAWACVIPGRVEDANPESQPSRYRDSQKCNCRSEGPFGSSRNDDVRRPTKP